MTYRPIYRVAVWHGENVSLYYVIEGDQNLDESDWEIIATFHNAQDAAHFLEERDHADSGGRQGRVYPLFLP